MKKPAVIIFFLILLAVLVSFFASKDAARRKEKEVREILGATKAQTMQQAMQIRQHSNPVQADLTGQMSKPTALYTFEV